LRALLLYRLMQKASANPSIRGTVVEIWATLASRGQYLKPLLEHNIIWSEEEKNWFADLKNANDGVRYIVNLMVSPSITVLIRSSKRLGRSISFMSRCSKA
jgi:hypothetical protein